MSDKLPDTFKAAFLASARGRIISALLIVMLVLGVAIEGVQLATGVFNMWIAQAEMRIKTTPAIRLGH